jgi:hypothetical protein
LTALLAGSVLLATVYGVLIGFGKAGFIGVFTAAVIIPAFGLFLASVLWKWAKNSN